MCYHGHMPPRPTDPAIRYHSKYIKRGPDDCWPWTASCYEGGYGAFWDGQTRTSAHRYGYRLLVGPISDGQCVCHTCDNRPCQNPSHWFLGTNPENTADRHQKGRSIGPRGELSGHSKLTAEQIIEIRELYRLGTLQRELAERFGINRPTVSQIVTGKRWGHIADSVSVNDGRTPLTADQVREMRRLYAQGASQYKLATLFGVSRPTVAGIVTRRYWKHVDD
jgi:DNA-binding CsgD family transcriptional regulator